MIIWKKIFITGGAGFIASTLASRCSCTDKILYGGNNSINFRRNSL